MDALLTALVRKVAVGNLQGRLAQHMAQRGVPAGAQAGRIGGDTARGKLGVLVVADEHLAGIGPKRVQRLLHPAMAFLGPVAQPHHQVGRALQVIGHLLARLGRNLGHARVRRSRQPLQQLVVPGVEQELPHQRMAEIAVRTLADQQVAEIPGVAQIGQVVGRAALPLDLAGQAQPKLRLADQVQRHVASAMSSSSAGE